LVVTHSPDGNEKSRRGAHHQLFGPNYQAHGAGRGHLKSIARQSRRRQKEDNAMLKPTFKKYAYLALALAIAPSATHASPPSLKWDNSVRFVIPGTDQPLPEAPLVWSSDPPPFMVPGSEQGLATGFRHLLGGHDAQAVRNALR
jgi:hypothetical protein